MADEISTEIAALEAEMVDTKARSGPDSYWQNETKQARYRQLTEAREQGGSVPAVSKASKEIASLEAEMADTNSDYYHSPTKQARYRELIGGAPEPEPGAVKGVEGISIPKNNIVPNTVMQEFNAAPDTEERFVNLHATGAAIEVGIADAAEVEAFAESISFLPEAVRDGFYREASMPAWSGPIPPASAEDIENFKADPAMARLANAWGADKTAHNVKIWHTRFERALEAASDEEFIEAFDWFSRLPDKDAMAVVWAFTGSGR